MEKSDLPFGSEFSPSQIELPLVLEFAKTHGGDWKAFENAVHETYFSGNDTSEYNQRKLANNCKLGMIAYGIIDRDANLTEFGEKLYECRADESELYTTLARHILVNLHGLNVINVVRDAKARGEKIDLLSLRSLLEERGIHFPRGGKHASIMRLWLEKAGVVISKDWDVNETRLEEILGLATPEVDALVALTPEQRAYIKAIVNTGNLSPLPSNEIERLATATYGIRFNEKNLPKQVLYPLQEAGFITLERGTHESGRGAKPFMVTPTEKLQNEVITPIIEQIEQDVSAHLRPFLRKPMQEILEEIESTDKYVKGLALEALAFHLMRLIDLTYVMTRLRGQATGGAEVDLLFESDRLLFSRWQIQCKNTNSVSLEDVAKEVGLTFQLKSNVIVVVTTGSIGNEAKRYANSVMHSTNLDIIFIDRTDLNQIIQNPVSIIDVLHREAKRAMEIKKLEI
ncbi:hypothetical protein AAC03nite_26350 [Alicyclobacillus acidoterrestris]|nr:hypothetical protein AAC03nite_26350 [Alicyclobacillus acidoterrestris]